MKTIPTQAPLSAYQTFIAEVCAQRGWDKRTALEKMLFLTEEVGEVAKEVRKQAGTYGYPTPPDANDLASELVDVLNYLFDIANMYDIDLDAAFQRNWTKNMTRVWN